MHSRALPSRIAADALFHECQRVLIGHGRLAHPPLDVCQARRSRAEMARRGRRGQALRGAAGARITSATFKGEFYAQTVDLGGVG